MKITRILTLPAAVLSAVFISLVSCHTETPMGIDNVDPSVRILSVYTDDQILFDSSLDTMYLDFSDTLFTEQLYVKAEIIDDQKNYELGLIAEDTLSGSEYIISSLRTEMNGEIVISASFRDFPIVQETPYQQFYLKMFVS